MKQFLEFLFSSNYFKHFISVYFWRENPILICLNRIFTIQQKREIINRGRDDDNDDYLVLRSQLEFLITFIYLLDPFYPKQIKTETG